MALLVEKMFSILFCFIYCCNLNWQYDMWVKGRNIMSRCLLLLFKKNHLFTVFYCHFFLNISTIVFFLKIAFIYACRCDWYCQQILLYSEVRGHKLYLWIDRVIIVVDNIWYGQMMAFIINITSLVKQNCLSWDSHN